MVGEREQGEMLFIWLVIAEAADRLLRRSSVVVQKFVRRMI